MSSSAADAVGDGVASQQPVDQCASAADELKGSLLQGAESALARVKVLSGRAAQLDASMRSLEQDLGFVKDELQKLSGETKRLALAAGPQARTTPLTARSSAQPLLGASAAHASAVERVLYSAHAVLVGSGPGGDLRGHMKAPSAGPFMNLMLGSAIKVQLSRPEARQKLKEEYYSFRDSTTPLHVVLPLLLLALRRRPPQEEQLPLHLRAALPPGSLTLLLPLCTQLYWCWLLWFYASLALREHALRINGSGIRNWWIRHHYYSLGLVLAALTWPAGSAVWHAFTDSYFLWAAAQGCVFSLQNQYQRKRTYTRIALGRASSMEVASGEAAATSGQLRALFPALFALQAAQARAGWGLLAAGARGLRAALQPEGAARAGGGALTASPLEWQAGLVGALLLVQAAGNFVSTVKAMADKRRAGRREAEAAEKALRR